MKKIKFVLFIVLFILSNKTFSQKITLTWEEFADKTEEESFNYNVEERRNSRCLNHHVRRFKKRWRKYNFDICNDTKKEILKNIECYYVCRYRIADIEDDCVEIKLTRIRINDIIFISKGYYLGNYEYNEPTQFCISKKINQYNKNNYEIAASRYFKVDRDFMIDFFEKGLPVYVIKNLSINKSYWLACVGNNTMKLDKDEILTLMVNFENKSEYINKFYE